MDTDFSDIIEERDDNDQENNELYSHQLYLDQYYRDQYNLEENIDNSAAVAENEQNDGNLGEFMKTMEEELMMMPDYKEDKGQEDNFDLGQRDTIEENYASNEEDVYRQRDSSSFQGCEEAANGKSQKETQPSSSERGYFEDILDNENCENPEEMVEDTQMNYEEVEEGRIDIIGEYEQEVLPDQPTNKDMKECVVKVNGGSANSESFYYLSIHKAGLETVDKDKIHKIIKEASKTSEFYKSEEKKLTEVKEKCKRYSEKVENVRKDPIVWDKLCQEVNRKIDILRKERDLRRTWIHVDMDAFYAAVEMRDDPTLADKPIAVAEKNMIMTTNYVARKFGVRSGVPGFIGKKLCPDLIFIKPDFSKYRKASEEFKSVLRKYDNDLESIGLDEVNMDVTDYLIKSKIDHQEGRIFLAQKIRREIFEKTKMTASCGISCNKMLAKICSDINKPNGQTYLHSSEIEISKFMNQLPVRKLVGVGKVNEQILHGMGIKQCNDVIEKAIDIFINFTENAFDFLVKSAMGIAKNTHDEVGLKKSLNVSQTFPTINDYESVKKKLEELCEEMEQRAKQEKLSGRTLTLEFKNEKFKNKQRSYTQNKFLQLKDELMKIAIQLLDSAWPLEPLRQISVKLLNLRDDTGKLSASATEVMFITQGRTKLGGNPKEVVPKALIAATSSDTSDVKQIIHHKIQPMFPAEHQEQELKKQKLKEYFIKKNFQKKVYALNSDPATSNSDSILQTKTSGVFIPFRKGFVKKWVPFKNNFTPKENEGASDTVQEQSYKEKYRSNWLSKNKYARMRDSYQNYQPTPEMNEMKTYKNFYKHNKLYISQYQKMVDQKGKGSTGGQAQSNGNAQKEKDQQKNIMSFIKNNSSGKQE